MGGSEDSVRLMRRLHPPMLIFGKGYLLLSRRNARLSQVSGRYHPHLDYTGATYIGPTFY